MFKNKRDDEIDFCESYKSQILNDGSTEKISSFNIILKILTILLLLVIIVAVSIYGYNYFLNNKRSSSIMPPVSVQVSDDELVVTEVDDEEESEQEVVKDDIKTPVVSSTVPVIIEESDIDEIANSVKIAIANSEKEELNRTKIEIEEKKALQENNLTKEEESLEVPTSSPEAQYLEELADLSKEIDKERK